MKTLLEAGITAKGRAPGKTILLGEHSAVYGHPALALGLPGVELEISVGERQISVWDEAWETEVCGEKLQTDGRMRSTLFMALDVVLKALTGQSYDNWHPFSLNIRSQIPLGAGMGGSAALGTALVRALAHCLGKVLLPSDELQLANALDGHFHGKASGLDAAAVATGGVIWFQKGQKIVSIQPPRSFHLVLVDTLERTETREMVEMVSVRYEKEPEKIAAILNQLKCLTQNAREALNTGELESLGKILDTGHEALRELGVSTPQLDATAALLRAHGALGAKLTGGGGGGLCLGLFAKPFAEPPPWLERLKSQCPVFESTVKAP